MTNDKFQNVFLAWRQLRQIPDRWGVLLVALFFLDIFTKWLAAGFMQAPLEIWRGVLRLAVSENPGVAFSIPIPNIIMIFATPLLLVALAWLIASSFNLQHPLARTALTLVLAGGIGNFVNRLANNAVIDFISFSFWPSFNLADSYLTVGVFLFLVFYGKIRQSN